MKSHGWRVRVEGNFCEVERAAGIETVLGGVMTTFTIAALPRFQPMVAGVP